MNVHIIDTTLEQWISSPIVELVPAVDEADGDLGELLLDCVDFVEKCLCGEAAAVKHLGTNSNGADSVLVAMHAVLQSIKILLEGGIRIGPINGVLVSNDSKPGRSLILILGRRKKKKHTRHQEQL